MPKLLFRIILTLALCTPFETKAAEDLINAEVLKQHFTDTAEFMTWYKTLDQDDKNQVLAGAVVLCRPNYVKIALENGGDAKTQAYTIQQALNSYANGHLYDHLIYTKGTIEDFRKDAADRPAGSNNFQNKDGNLLQIPFHGPLNRNKVSLLIQAAQNCQNDDRMQLFQLLLKNGADVNAANSENENVFTATLQEPYINRENARQNTHTTNDLIEYLFEHISPEGLNPEIATKLVSDAIIADETNLLELYREHNLQIYPNTKAARKALFKATKSHNKAAMELLKQFLKNGADVNYQNDKGQTALNYAVASITKVNSFGSEINMTAVQILLKNGADVNLADNEGTPPLFYAAMRQDIALLRLLLDHGANIKAQDNNGNTVLHATTFDLSRREPLDSEVLKLLIERGADIAVKNKDGETALPKIAETFGNAENIALLLENTAAPQELHEAKSLALYNAVCTYPSSRSKNNETEDVQTVQILLKFGADINFRDYNSETALFKAADCHHLEIAEFLLKKGIDIGAKNNQGQTVFDKFCAQKKEIDDPDITNDPMYRKIIEDNDTLQASEFCQLHPLGVAAFKKSGRGEIELKGNTVPDDMSLDGNLSSPEVVDLKSKTQKYFAQMIKKRDKLNAPANVSVPNLPNRQDQTSLLTAAVKKNDCRKIEQYLSAGGNPYVQIPLVYDERINQPLIAQVVSNFGCLETVLKYDIDVNRKIDGDSLLMYAVYAQNKQSAELLLNKGANANTLNRSNITPLAMAMSQDDVDMVKLLRQHGAKEKIEREEMSAEKPIKSQNATTEKSSFSEVKPSIVLTPQEIDLGQVTTGNLATALITISAEDGKEVRVSAISVENPPYDKFEYVSDCNGRAIADTQTCGIEIAWAPENADSFQGKFKILWQETNTSDNSAKQAEVKISGTAVAAPTVDSGHVKTVRLIFDLKAKPIGYIGEDEQIYDFNQNIIGKLDKNEDVRDESDKIIGRSDDIWRDLLFDKSGNIIGWKDDDGTITEIK